MIQAKTVAPSGELRLIPGVFKRTDSGNAERFAARYRSDVRYVDPRRKWLVWDGTRWQWDRGKSIELRAKEMARAIMLEADACSDMKEVGDIRAWSVKSESAGKRQATLALACSEPGITIDLDGLDADPWLLNCKNGTLDLRTGELHTHRRENMITKRTACAYDPKAGTFLWDTVLGNMTGGDKELGSYLQRIAGYALTGMATERKLFFLYGPPGSGKSTFIEALLSCMGDYAHATSFDTWLEHNNVGGNRDDLVKLQGVRLVTSGEVSATKHWDTALLKKFTGGDRISATAKFESEISYLANCTLVFAANDAPKAREDDSGFWERMQRIPITNVVPVEQRVKDLHAQLREPDNAEAILAWAVEGCKEWQQTGIGTSSVVTVSSAEYREENDWIGGFLEGYELVERCTITTAEFRRQYAKYCEDEGQKPESNKTLALKIKKRTDGKVQYLKIDGYRMWRGLRLLGAPPPAQGSLKMPPEERFE